MNLADAEGSSDWLDTPPDLPDYDPAAEVEHEAWVRSRREWGDWS
jgi:hypothetical protein